MSDNSKIEWCETTWNPIVGCTPASEGCRYCYAARMATRLAAMGHEKYQGVATKGKWTGKIRFDPVELAKTFRWRKSRMVFVCSMGDLFHKDVSWADITAVYSAMIAKQDCTFMVLTKRPKRVAEYYQVIGGMNMSPPNIWLGVSVENQSRAEERIPTLLSIPAAKHFVSFEPLLGDVGDLMPYLTAPGCAGCYGEGKIAPSNTPCKFCYEGLDWVIAGGESGPGARPMNPVWVRSIRDQCIEAGVPFFFKQWGAWCPTECLPPGTKLPGYPDMIAEEWDGEAGEIFPVSKKAAGRLLDGREWNERPE